jgi:riboflavin synthase
MFTGIIEAVGEIAAIEPLAAGRRLTVRSDPPFIGIEIGESIALDGACMTVVALTSHLFAVDVSAESLRRTTLGQRVAGDHVNLERSMSLGERLGGHLVTGHVDGTGTVASIDREGESALYRFQVPPELARLLVEKGSVAVDGISLTCFDCTPNSFVVAVIPHTAEVTTLGRKRPGDTVNIENDLLGKYVEKLVEPWRTRTGSGES